ncbi:hypothetical protein KO566_01590 [Flavobacteriaceae bacterium XHP0103]|uniref:hypothetical protein n=1 Tax=Marixanthotalea marina TaxID=2844359 RepID=UPI002989CA7F|nr:hypothetical protein [Marixanthotalea marina]MBU3820739.1 hypothetical protein [Marixanthotalea marina]
MKKVIENTKKGILIVAMLAASFSFANEGTPFFKVVNDVKKTALTIANVKKGNLLSIKDAYGSVLYTETIKENGTYAKGFDLTALENGSYLFELDSDVELRTIPFSIEGNTIKFHRDIAKTSFKPVTRTEGNLVFISKLSLNGEPLKIDIYHDAELMLTETVKDTKNIEKVYKLTGLDKGEYKIVLNTEGKTYTKFINN